MSNAVDRFVQHGLGAKFSDIPEAAVVAIKTYLLDTLGVGVAGARAPLTARIREAAMAWGGEGPALLLGPDMHNATAAQAAFVNAFQIHCQEYDCVHEPAVVHPLATILSVLIATTQTLERPISGPDFAAAIAVSVDMAAGLGVAAKSPIKFFRPATAGIFGSVLGSARLRGFDEAQTKSALGYALAFCSGTMQAHVEGKPALPVQIANAARGAIMACDLAEVGIDGPHDVFEGPFGYLSLFEDETDLAPIVDQLGTTWRIAEVSHKPFPTGRAAQGGIVLMQKLRAEGVDAGNIIQITLSAPPLIERLVGRRVMNDMTANYARLCFGYSGAVALLRGSVGLSDFSETALRDEEVLALANKIKVVVNDVSDPAAFVPQSVEARLANGQAMLAEIDTLYGSPADPMNQAAHFKKFNDCMTFGFGSEVPERCGQMINLTDEFETLDDVSMLFQLAAGGEV